MRQEILLLGFGLEMSWNVYEYIIMVVPVGAPHTMMAADK